ncbi:MAG TPA: septum formation initiator family protein [Dehalococcoidia bacterium]
MAIVVAVLQINQFSRLTSTGYQIDELNRERATKQAANHDLEAEVAQLSSLARVDWEARTRLGMQPANRTLYIDVNAELPAHDSLPTRYAAPDGADAETKDTNAQQPLWKRALKLLPF